jgi:hypothetical protein
MICRNPMVIETLGDQTQRRKRDTRRVAGCIGGIADAAWFHSVGGDPISGAGNRTGDGVQAVLPQRSGGSGFGLRYTIALASTRWPASGGLEDLAKCVWKKRTICWFLAWKTQRKPASYTGAESNSMEVLRYFQWVNIRKSRLARRRRGILNENPK